MKILFVSSGNNFSGPSPIIINQGNSLIKEGVQLHYFTINSKGIAGYSQNIFRLRAFLRTNQFDVIHAHYSWSAFVASLAGARPLVVSLMGSDIKAKTIFKILIRIFAALSWHTVIVKSHDAWVSLGLKKANIIPNGVDFERFKPIEKDTALEVTKWDKLKKHVLFAANPSREEKNFPLAKKAFDNMNYPNAELHFLSGISNELVPYYYNSSDVVLLTSLWEGSPNVIKEAMACNIPVVATDVGDIKTVIGGIEGCYVSPFDAAKLAIGLKNALVFSCRTRGRSSISHLNSASVAQELIRLYKNVLPLK